MLVNVYFDQLFQLMDVFVVVEDYYHKQKLMIFVFYLLLMVYPQHYLNVQFRKKQQTK